MPTGTATPASGVLRHEVGDEHERGADEGGCRERGARRARRARRAMGGETRATNAIGSGERRGDGDEGDADEDGRTADARCPQAEPAGGVVVEREERHPCGQQRGEQRQHRRRGRGDRELGPRDVRDAADHPHERRRGLAHARHG